MAKKEQIRTDILLYDVELNSTNYSNRVIIQNIALANVIKSLQKFDKEVKINNKGMVSNLFYNIKLWNRTYSIETLFTKATVTFLVDSLKKLDGQIKINEKIGNSVKGKSINSKNTKPNKTQYNNLKI